VIEIVDAEEKVTTFLPVVDELVTEGLVTLEAVRIVRYVSRGGDGTPLAMPPVTKN
jgi:PII-like signaling protein